jgi:hypothetical protein
LWNFSRYLVKFLGHSGPSSFKKNLFFYKIGINDWGEA